MSIWMAMRPTCQDAAAMRAAFDNGRWMRGEDRGTTEIVFRRGNDVRVRGEMVDEDFRERFEGVAAPDPNAPSDRDA